MTLEVPGVGSVTVSAAPADLSSSKKYSVIAACTSAVAGMVAVSSCCA